MEGRVEDVFRSFTGGSNEMDGRQFAKVMKDCGILDKKFTATDVDLLFAKIKDPSARKINFNQFDQAIGNIAVKKGTSKELIYQSLRESGGPKYIGTKAHDVKLGEDRSPNVGIYLQASPTKEKQRLSDAYINQLKDEDRKYKN